MQVEMVHGPKVTDAHRRACALLAQEAFRTQRISHHRRSKMPHRGQKVPIRVPSSIKDGYYFLTSREYRSKDGVLYNYELYNKHGLRLKPQTRGKRKMLCFFSLGRAAQQSQRTCTECLLSISRNAIGKGPHCFGPALFMCTTDRSQSGGLGRIALGRTCL